MRRNSLITRFTLILCFFITAILAVTGAVFALSLKSDLISIAYDSYERFTEARADEVSKYLSDHWDTISTFSVMEDMTNGSLDDARALVAPITDSGIVKSIISIAIINNERTLKLFSGRSIDISTSDVLIPNSSIENVKPAVTLTQAVKRTNKETFAIVMQIYLGGDADLTNALTVQRQDEISSNVRAVPYII